MFRFPHAARSVLALVLLGAISACSEDNQEVLGPKLSGENAIFQNYVAIGNSITAGYQSSGINASTQAQAYPVLLARQMGTRFAIPALNGRGCAPPVVNFQTQEGFGGVSSTARASTCDARKETTSATLNNVAVPGASSYDPTMDATPFTNTLTSLFLGGKTQVEKALEVNPTFATIWIGNNDVLGFAVADGRTSAATGLAGMTPTATFTANYDAMISALADDVPDIKGVLIGVVQVANAPIMFQAAALSNPLFKGGFDAIAGTTTVLDPSCVPPAAGAASLINTFLAFQIRLGAHPATIACVPGGTSGLLPAPIGDILVLDPAEQVTVKTRIDEYNAYISAKAGSFGFAYFDPNSLLVSLKAGGTLISPLPNFGATGTFGSGMSLDGVHPAAAVQREIANALIPVINAKYNTSLALVP